MAINLTLNDFRGVLASFWRTSDMKTANDRVRDLFLKTVADMFGEEKFIPDIVRDNMKLEDFGKGKPLTARRINLVRVAIDTLGAVTIRYSEPKGLPVKFSWTTTIDVDGNAVTTPMRVDHS